jgi:hypothetical protein
MFVQLGRYRDDDLPREENIVIHPYDTWNMDHTLALIILPMLKQLKATKHGAPLVDDEDVPDSLKSTSAPPKANDWDTDENHFKRWDYVLDEMIWAFQHEVDDDWEDLFFQDEEPQYALKELKSIGVGPGQLRLFPDEDGKTIDYELYELIRDDTPSRFDKEGYDNYSKRIANGFRLFGKYYQSLWD